MFKVTTKNGQSYKVYFSYEYADTIDVSSQHYPIITDCVIERESGELVSIGSAFKSPRDNFSKAVGRKLALGRALSVLPREERKEFWEKYFEKIGGIK